MLQFHLKDLLKLQLSFLISFAFIANVSAQHTNVDVLEYVVFLKVNDTTDRIEVIENIGFMWLDTTEQISFDLCTLNESGKGMKVSSVKDGQSEVQFEQRNDQLFFISLKNRGRRKIELTISYNGIPQDGLVIAKNKYGHRTFFGDNWPNRAHHWLVCNDHPSDKAVIHFKVQVPGHYDVVANGEQLGIIDLPNQEKIVEFRSHVELPTKVMVVGIADFIMKESGDIDGIKVRSCVYPENAENTIHDMEVAPAIMKFFSELIATYEFEKLDNVQSTTRYGGMENAGCIFYDENAFTGSRSSENLIAHEITHQWFGNSATETDWKHLWLSEGFASYFTNVYVEQTKGIQPFRKQMEKDRQAVIKFYSTYPHPVIDSTYLDVNDLLNINSYQKGAWILHMLRRKIGDTLFFTGIQNYYSRYRLSNASTNDFCHVMEQVSGIDLSTFFQQWLFSAGHPQLKIKSLIKRKHLDISIEQVQTDLIFEVPLTVELDLENGQHQKEVLQLDGKKEVFHLTAKSKIKSIQIDPEIDLLFERVK